MTHTLAPAAEPLWHGYTFTDIDKAARMAASRSWWRNDIDGEERYAAARHAIIEHLATATDRPELPELHGVGRNAAGRTAQAEMHTRGYDMDHTDRGPGSLRGFQRYWHIADGAPWEDRVVEHLALQQIWPHLTLSMQQAVMALALTGDHRDAARSLGIALGAYQVRIRDARRRALGLWHEGETPRRLPPDRRAAGVGSAVASGRGRMTVSELEQVRDRAAAGEKVAVLALEFGYSKGALYALLQGKSRPVPDRASA